MSYLTLIHKIGGKGGSRFEMTGLDNGSTLEKLWVWVGGWQVKALKFWFSDGRNRKIGNPGGEFSEFQFKAGEHFTKLSLWGNGIGTHLGAIKFTTNQSREFFARMTDWGLKTEYPIDVGSGICVGVTGRAGADIDALAFMFINTIKSTVMKDVRYPTLRHVKPQVAVKEIKSMTYENVTSVAQQHTIAASETITTRSSWSVTNKLEMNFDFEVKAGIPKVVEVTAGFGFTMGTESTHALEEEKSKTETLSFPVNVPPGKTVQIDITIGKVTIDLPYTARVEITCYNDSVLRFNTSGIYKGLTYTDAKTVAKKIPPIQCALS